MPAGDIPRRVFLYRYFRLLLATQNVVAIQEAASTPGQIGMWTDATTGPNVRIGVGVDDAFASIHAVPPIINVHHVANITSVATNRSVKAPSAPQSRGNTRISQAFVKNSRTTRDVASRNPKGQFVGIFGTTVNSANQSAPTTMPTTTQKRFINLH